MSELRLCKEDFMQYRTLEVQEKFYKKQLAELRDKYLVVDTVQDYRSGQARTIKIEDIQQTAYMREKASQSFWKLLRNVGLSEGQ